ncbi:MAG TPA: hypothetical protein VK184_25605, partial [Nostocaceae cyanobacterium]|nr:hypothetical protein [Nostocaceae cyanobacterium]
MTHIIEAVVVPEDVDIVDCDQSGSFMVYYKYHKFGAASPNQHGWISQLHHQGWDCLQHVSHEQAISHILSALPSPLPSSVPVPVPPQFHYSKGKADNMFQSFGVWFGPHFLGRIYLDLHSSLFFLSTHNSPFFPNLPSASSFLLSR